MSVAYLALLLVAIAANLVAAAVGGIAWFGDRISIVFWYLLRVAQLTMLVFVATEAVVYIQGHRADNELHYIYVALPVIASFLAEGMRAGSASEILGDTDHHSLSEARQEEVALKIVHRETGIMAIGSLVTAFLIWRALVTATGMF